MKSQTQNLIIALVVAVILFIITAWKLWFVETACTQTKAHLFTLQQKLQKEAEEDHKFRHTIDSLQRAVERGKLLSSGLHSPANGDWFISVDSAQTINFY